MADYDNFTERPEITRFGKRRVEIHNRRFLSRIFKYSSSDPGELDLLEVGPGDGYFASAASDEDDIKYFAVEANEKMAKSLSRAGFETKHSRVPPIPFDRTFDVIYLDQVLEHIPEEDVNRLFREFRLHLKPKGMLVVVAPDYMVWGKYFFDSDYTHKNITTLNRCKQILFDTDFKVLESGYIAIPFEGGIQTQLLALAIRLLDASKIPRFLIGEPRFRKVKSSFLRSFYVIAQSKR